MIEPKLELKKVNKQLNRLDLVKQRAELRTKRRIAEQIEKEQLDKLGIETATVEVKKG
jgi:hypothetical protein